MDPNFWQDRWKQGQIGFHRSDVNPFLVEHWGALGLQANDRVFVPLCGKSLDMLWLRDRGHSVLGVELSPIAVRDFFVAAWLTPEVSRSNAFEVSNTKGIEIRQGDFFALGAEDFVGVRAVYDRAALIALPPNLRVAYARALREKLPKSVRMLLVVLEANPASTGGPPFSVTEKEVRELYEPAFDIKVLHRGPFEEPPPHLKDRGHATVADVVYELERD